jgi:hypothetical protein
MTRTLALSLWLVMLGWPAVQSAEPGTIPLEFPAVATTARPGQWVLCPPRKFVDNLREAGPVKTALIYYAATMKEPGEVESTVVDLGKNEMVIPNSLILPIPLGQTATPGDVILTWWQSGSGMQRAIVVEGGTETEPMVRYLDISYENPSGWGQKTDRCRPNTFYKLESPFQLGTTVALKDPRFPQQASRAQIVAEADDRYLVLGFAGRISVAQKADCVALPIKPELMPEDTVLSTTTFARLEKVTVSKVAPEIGRVFIRYTSAGKERELAVPYGNITTELP